MTPLPPLLLRGDALTQLARIPDDSIDAVVTDPPYGLANTDPAHVVEALTRWASGDRGFIPEGRGFMGKAWDAFVPPPAVWDECMRVLKPGGHLLAFAGSRTFDLMTLSVRFAGFDIRDSIAWLYGSGFPKSMDVSKAIDKMNGSHTAFREFARAYSAAVSASPLTHAEVDRRLGIKSSSSYWAREDHRGGMPPRHHWEAVRALINVPTHLVTLYVEAERADREVAAPGSNAIFQPTQRVVNAGTPQTDAAREWDGWGTALKPAFEPIVVARKPFSGTVAANVLEHGTGALNIDATRIHAADSGAKAYSVKRMATGADQNRDGRTHQDDVKFEGETKSGRWPANVMLDESQAAELDRQTGTLTSGRMAAGTSRSTRQGAAFGAMPAETGAETYGDSGGASRFFYVAKAPKSERPVVDGVAHPTVKPLTLMRQLVRLVTPPGGVVLDPFAGSGTTLEATYVEGFESIGVELTPDYWPLIEARIARIVG